MYWRSGSFPFFLQHGNPTSGFLYRKVAARLPTDRTRLDNMKEEVPDEIVSAILRVVDAVRNPG